MPIFEITKAISEANQRQSELLRSKNNDELGAMLRNEEKHETLTFFNAIGFGSVALAVAVETGRLAYTGHSTVDAAISGVTAGIFAVSWLTAAKVATKAQKIRNELEARKKRFERRIKSVRLSPAW